MWLYQCVQCGSGIVLKKCLVGKKQKTSGWLDCRLSGIVVYFLVFFVVVCLFTLDGYGLQLYAGRGILPLNYLRKTEL
jgi:hypothetical protein